MNGVGVERDSKKRWFREGKGCPTSLYLISDSWDGFIEFINLSCALLTLQLQSI